MLGIVESTLAFLGKLAAGTGVKRLSADAWKKTKKLTGLSNPFFIALKEQARKSDFDKEIARYFSMWWRTREPLELLQSSLYSIDSGTVAKGLASRFHQFTGYVYNADSRRVEQLSAATKKRVNMVNRADHAVRAAEASRMVSAEPRHHPWCASSAHIQLVMRASGNK